MSINNPYASPQAASSGAGYPGGAEMLSITGLSKTLMFCYRAYFILGLIGIALNVWGMSVSDANLDANPMSSNAMAFAVASLTYVLVVLPLYLTTAFCHLKWTSRTCKNCIAMGAVGKKFSPGWSMGWFFVPFANLVMPHRVACEIYQASQPGDGTSWQHRPAPSYLGLWWGLYVVSGIFDRIATRSERYDIDLGIVGDLFSIFALVLMVGSARLAHRYIKEVFEMQSGSQVDPDSEITQPGENPYAAPARRF